MNGEFDKTLVDEAVRIVTGDRPGKYGPPEDNFKNIALIWQGILRAHHGQEMDVKDLDARDVSLMMVGLKIARESNCHQRDNIVDGVGYFLTTDRVTFDQDQDQDDELQKKIVYDPDRGEYALGPGFETCKDRHCGQYGWIAKSPHVHTYRNEKQVVNWATTCFKVSSDCFGTIHHGSCQAHCKWGPQEECGHPKWWHQEVVQEGEP